MGNFVAERTTSDRDSICFLESVLAWSTRHSLPVTTRFTSPIPFLFLSQATSSLYFSAEQISLVSNGLGLGGALCTNPPHYQQPH